MNMNIEQMQNLTLQPAVSEESKEGFEESREIMEDYYNHIIDLYKMRCDEFVL